MSTAEVGGGAVPVERAAAPAENVDAVPAQNADGVPAETAAAPAVVVHGRATPEEVAALVAALSAVAGGEPPASEHPSSTWAAHSAAMRPPVSHGPGAWRTALRP